MRPGTVNALEPTGSQPSVNKTTGNVTEKLTLQIAGFGPRNISVNVPAGCQCKQNAVFFLTAEVVFALDKLYLYAVHLQLATYFCEGGRWGRGGELMAVVSNVHREGFTDAFIYVYAVSGH